MKIIGGNYGLKGYVTISDDALFINGNRKARFSPGQIVNVSAEAKAEKKFSILSFFFGALILCLLLGLLLNILGVVIGLVIAVAGSFYTNKENIAEITFDDQSSLKLECTPRGIKKLYRFQSGNG
jgi:hypothetical protein